jgi:catalase
MPDDANTPGERRPSALTRGEAVVRLAAIGAIVLTVTGGFAYAGGWLRPARLTPVRLVDTFEQVNVLHSGFRRNHAKGVCVAGSFDSNGRGVRLSRAAVFVPGRVPRVVTVAGSPGDR